MKFKSVKSINQSQSMVLTLFDIVKAHGGELRVESVEGEGTTFIIEFSNHII